MRILFLASRFPYPPDRGDRVRAYHLLRELSRDHEVDLLSFVEEPVGEVERRELRKTCRRVEEVVLPKTVSTLRAFGGLLSSDPLQVRYYRDKRFAAAVRRLSGERRYDLVFSHLFRVFPYAGLATGAFRLLDLTDVVSREVAESALYRSFPMSWIYRLESGRIRRFERKACLGADEVWVISEAERQLLERVVPSGLVRVIPNGVDHDLLEGPPPEPEPGTIGFLGHLGVFHNVVGLRFFTESVLPGVRARFPGARFVIAGTGASAAVRELARREGVVLRGRVDDLGDFFRRVSLFVAPLRFAAGTQNKVIQAMAAGSPVLVSPEVSSGIGAEPGREILVARSVEEWIEMTSEALSEPIRAGGIGEAGRKFARSRFAWRVARERAREIESAIGAGKHPARPVC